MDGLALLCNLFADGPVTLERLRIARVSNLTELERAAPARLAEWLHSSVPQAQAFAEEARKLVRRLAEGTSASARSTSGFEAPDEPEPAIEPVRPAEGVHASQVAPLRDGSRALAAAPGSQRLRAGLFPGLDEALCARLALHRVDTVQALREFSGLALARRTGIPYSTLLELARHARRFGLVRAHESGAPATPFAAGGRSEEKSSEPREVAIRSVELVPFDARARRVPPETELARSDEFTLPMAEPDSAGPFG